MGKNTVTDLILKIQDSNSWGIWAIPDPDGKIKATSPARYGQTQFVQGGMIDAYTEFVCDGELANRFVARELGDDCTFDESIENAYDWEFAVQLWLDER